MGMMNLKNIWFGYHFPSIIDERILAALGVQSVSYTHLVFGLSEDRMIAPMDEREGRFLLDEIMRRGV